MLLSDQIQNEEVTELPEMVVLGERSQDGHFIEPTPVAPRVTVTPAEIAAVNVVNPSDIFKYMSSVNFRKRFIGDSNIPVAIRANNEQMIGRVLVYVDDLLISNFLGGHSAGARLFMVAPQEIVGADIMYGPYSAMYPGNSIGGVITIHTRMPETFEVHTSSGFFVQEFKDYGTDDTFLGYKFDASVGDKLGRFGYFVHYRHLENEAPPQSFRAVTNPQAAQPGDPIVSGAFRGKQTRPELIVLFMEVLGPGR
ncbi:MAG: TonB-dependent receptor plug domain-containing protein [Candidatus Loosdrechtia sp.]|uniref:TonB-dependent receptor plug domain-containing protein n=1 Tax=Candidatus Loosdrechtia sp. TaxID=3101272 RepID=UPI003A6DB4E6|nr:MAG: TonB-dependent receptor plug domain-containing protein [Candidatus Jettenia sp. AMX2]